MADKPRIAHLSGSNATIAERVAAYQRVFDPH